MSEAQVPVPGSKEHDAAMAAKFEAVTTAAPTNAAGRPVGTEPAAPAKGSEPAKPVKPEGVPEKFWNAEKGEVNFAEWTKSTTAAEQKITELSKTQSDATAQAAAKEKADHEAAVKTHADGKAAAEKKVADLKAAGAKAEEIAAAEKAVTDYPAAPKAPVADAAADALAQRGLDLNSFSAEFQKEGKLSDASYKALADKGIPKETVDGYIAGQQALAAQFDSAVHTAAGGKESYEKMIAWAKTNLPRGEAEAFNRAVNGTLDEAKLATAGLHQKYSAANGTEPTLLGGNSATPAAGAFKSNAEMTAAIRDPRYDKDPAYRKEVEQRIAAM